MKKLILPVSILLGCFILGGFYYASELNKQASVERQLQIEQQAITDRNNANIFAATELQMNMDNCVKKAEADNILNINNNYYTPVFRETLYQNAISVCYKQYK